MEHQINQGQKFATLLLAFSILIAGLVVGGAIITRSGNQNIGGSPVEPAYADPHSHQEVAQPQSGVQQAPGCGV